MELSDAVAALLPRQGERVHARRTGLRSTPDRAGVGASLTAFRRALGSVARAGRGYRAVVGVGTKDAADVRLTVSRSGKVTKVTVTLLRRSALDAAGKTLLRRAG